MRICSSEHILPVKPIVSGQWSVGGWRLAVGGVRGAERIIEYSAPATRRGVPPAGIPWLIILLLRRNYRNFTNARRDFQLLYPMR